MRGRTSARASWRSLKVFWIFLPFTVAYLRDRRRYVLFGSGRRVSAERQRRRATRLLETLIDLGPTFIKLGQLLSTRPDVLPPVYLEVMGTLQDDVPPAPWSEAEAVIEDELGPVDEHFEAFDTDPISGASLGQVYRATVEDEPVAVKVRRPGVESLVEADLVVIRWILRIALPFVDDARAFSIRNLADEFGRTIREEMDYHHERAMLEEIRGNFVDRPSVRMPRVVDTHSGERVLTMEYVEGTKVTDVEGLRARAIDRTAVAERLELAYFRMIVEDGVFHADPHPGNIAVQDDGTIVFYDFGITGRVPPFVQGKIVDFYVGIVNDDIDAILDTLVEVGTLSPDADRRVMGEILEIAIEDARGRTVEQYRIQQIVRQIEESIYEFPLRLPANLALILRVATVVEGVCVTLNPEYDFIAVASNYLREQGYIEESVRQFLGDARGDLTQAARSSVAIPPKLEDALDRVEHGDFRVEANLVDENRLLDRLARRVVLGLLASAAVVSGAILLAADEAVASAIAIAGALGIVLVLWHSLRRRRRGIRARPQFTRQEMRRRRGEE
ncbi:MAG: ABC1 kinase family protein [Halobacteriales archaeon]